MPEFDGLVHSTPERQPKMAGVGPLPEQRALTVNDAIRGLWSGVHTSVGLKVDEKSSLQVISVFTAVRILSEGFAQVPLKVYRSNGDDSRSEMRQHPLYNLLHNMPNDRMTAFGMREHWMMSLALWGNSYTEIIRNNRGDVMELWPLNPAAVKPERSRDGGIIYRVRTNNDVYGYSPSADTETLTEDQVLHIRGFSLDGLRGLSPIEMIRENVGLASAYQEFAARFFSNGGVPGFVLSTDKVMQEPQLESAHREWNENYAGLRNAQKVAILHGGMKPVTIGIPPEDMQFLESRQLEREEIFSFYRIPPNFYSANRITSWGSGIKEMSVGFVKFTLDPWFVRVENALNTKFFSAPAQGPLFPEFDREGFLRGDFPTRIDGYEKLWNMGVVSNKWIAKTENLPEPKVELYLVPSSMTPVDKIEAIADKLATPAPAPVQGPTSDNVAARAMLITSQRVFVMDAIDRIVRRANYDTGQAREKRKGEDLETWLAEFAVEHRDFAEKKLALSLDGLAEVIRIDVARETGKDVPPFPNYLKVSTAALAKRVAEIPTAGEALDDVHRLANSLALTAYRQAGLTPQWVARDDCAECRAADGGEEMPEQCLNCQCVFIANRTSAIAERPESPRGQVIVMPAPAPAAPSRMEFQFVQPPTDAELRQELEEGKVKDEDIKKITEGIKEGNRELLLEFAKNMRSLMPEPAPREAPPPIVLNFPKDAIKVEVSPAIVNIHEGAIKADTHVQMPSAKTTDKVIEYDQQGRLHAIRDRLGN